MKKLAAIITFVALLAFASTATAHDWDHHGSYHHGYYGDYGVGVYVAPAPVYAPPPGYYYAPAPVYAPPVYAPAPIYAPYGGGIGVGVRTGHFRLGIGW